MGQGGLGSLDLGGNPLGNAGAALLARCLRSRAWPGLRVLGLRGTHVTGRGAGDVIECLEGPRGPGVSEQGLGQLDLGDNALGEADLAPLALAYARRRSVCRVCLDGTAVPPRAAAGLEAARAWAAGAQLGLADGALALAALAAAAVRFATTAVRTDSDPNSQASETATLRAAAAAAAACLGTEGEALARALLSFRKALAAGEHVEARRGCVDEAASEIATLEALLVEMRLRAVPQAAAVGVASVGACGEVSAAEEMPPCEEAYVSGWESERATVD